MARTHVAGQQATETGAKKGRAAAKRGSAHSIDRRGAVLAAALDEFAARGFAAARLDDVAKRAGVAKGTIYLYFDDKESLFQELVRSMLGPQLSVLETVHDAPVRVIVEKFFERFLQEIYETRRRDVLRLMLTEGHRFPKLAEFYYREVVERAMAAMRAVLARAVARGELPDDSLVLFPQLLVSPLLLAVTWSGLFERFAPLDVRALMQAHIALLFDDRTTP